MASLRARLSAIVERYGWQSRASIVGHVPYASDALVKHYREADLFAHPSIPVGIAKEGIPGTIVEAMASGIPVVATRHGGIPEVIEDGRDGLLVDEHDVSGLADALDSLLTNAAPSSTARRSSRSPLQPLCSTCVHAPRNSSASTTS